MNEFIRFKGSVFSPSTFSAGTDSVVTTDYLDTAHSSLI